VALDNHSFYDTTALLDNPRARGPALSVIYHQISLSLDGAPVLIPADEGWRALVDPDFSIMIGKQIRTIRSKGGAVVFITQSPSDVLESGIAHILKEHCHTQIHLNNRRADKADYVGGFGLTEGQYEAFHCMPSTPGTFLLIQDEQGVVAQLPLGDLPEYLSVLSAPERDLIQHDEEMMEAAE
jgi:type IV secretion system protein VirB4